MAQKAKSFYYPVLQELSAKSYFSLTLESVKERKKEIYVLDT